MTITLNGAANDDFTGPLKVSELLSSLGLAGRPVVVELDGIALRPREFAEAQVREGSVIEIINVAAGG